MKRIQWILFAIGLCVIANAMAAKPSEGRISGNYLEVRSCDVYTGPCFSNSEMGLTGKEAILVWSVAEGEWQGVPLDGLNVIAVVKTDDTLGNVAFQPRKGVASLIVDERADERQRKALRSFACSMAGDLVCDVVKVHTSPIEAVFAGCSKESCATVRAASLVNISTRCLGEKDHLCGNEEVYYPPLSPSKAVPAFTQLASFQSKELGRTWSNSGGRSAFVGTFQR